MPRCFYRNAQAEQCESEALEGLAYCDMHAQFENDVSSKLNHIIVAISDSRTQEKKDFWDKVSASATLISGLFVGLVGITATTLYNNRELDSQQADQIESIQVRRVEIVQKFFPHLVSSAESEKKGALLAIASLGDERLATDLAQNFGDGASIEALRRLANSNDIEIAARAEEVLTGTLLSDLLSKGSVRVIVRERRASGFGTGFFVSNEGHFITAGHVIPETAESEAVVEVYDGSRHTAELLLVDREHDIAVGIIKTGSSKISFETLDLSAVDLPLGTKLFSVGFRSANFDFGRVFNEGVLSSVNIQGDSWLLDIPSSAGASGSPISTSTGQIVGYVTGSVFRVIEGNRARAGVTMRPISSIKSLLREIPGIEITQTSAGDLGLKN